MIEARATSARKALLWLREKLKRCAGGQSGRLYRSWRLKYFLRKSYEYDIRRFLEHADLSLHEPTRENLRARLLMKAHRLEKGLTLTGWRRLFGDQVIAELDEDLETYAARFGLDDYSRAALGALRTYCVLHEEDGHHAAKAARILQTATARFGCADLPSCAGAVAVLKKEDVQPGGAGTFEQVICTRHSVRSFSDESVDPDLLKQAVALAIGTPSVCNRQPWNVYVASEVGHVREILALQNGNRGFDGSIKVLLIVTGNLESFVSIGERNQVWVDAGMFSMSLVLAIHSVGLGTCCLNWSVTEDRDRELRRVAAIPSSEAVAMMIAVGHIPDELSVTNALRRKVGEVLRELAPRPGSGGVGHEA